MNQNTPINTSSNDPSQIRDEIDLRMVLSSIKRHPVWLVFCLILCIFLERHFYLFPPRGFASTDVIYLGNVWGSPLVDFTRIWNRLYHDDRFMLELVESSKFTEKEGIEDALQCLNRSIRPNLSFTTEKNNLVKITFRQSSAKKIRGFLSCFSRNLMQELHVLEREEMEMRIRRVMARLMQLNRRSAIISQGFGLPKDAFFHSLTQILPPFSDFLASATLIVWDGSKQDSDTGNTSFISSFGQLGLNELDTLRFFSTMELQAMISTDSFFLKFYPHDAILLTDARTQPKSVQPFVELIFTLVPLGIFLIWFSGLIFMESFSSRVSPNLNN